MLSYFDLSSRIVGAAFRVHNALGPGYRESVYRNALAVELGIDQIPCVVESFLPVDYREVPVGHCFADLVVSRLIAVETKAKDAVLPGHVTQLKAYMRCSGLQVGLVLNFGPGKVDVRREDWVRGREEAG